MERQQTVNLNKEGTLLFNQGKYEEAIEKYRQAIKINSHDPEIYNNL